MVGMRLATLHPGRVERLVLCDTAAHMGPAELWEGRVQLAERGGMAAVVDATIERWFTAPFRAKDPRAVGRIHDMILNTPVNGYAGRSEEHTSELQSLMR